MNVDQLIVLVYLVAVVAFGCWFVFSARSSEQFMSAGQSIPGWALGLSIFGSYVSTLSFLGNPAAAYSGNWSRLVAAFATPLGAIAATFFFIPFYRRTGELSAYQHLEHRFGAWARTYGVVCFVMLQVVRLGMITQLLGTVLAPLFDWDTRAMVIFLGVLITIYPMLGGTEGVIWAGVVQSVVLILGVIACVYYVIAGVPGGVPAIIDTGKAVTAQGPLGKFSLGSFEFTLFATSFWVVLLNGLNEQVRNFAIDQSYVQRYLTARTQGDAARSVWYGILLYLPMAALFFFIGTALHSYVQANPNFLPSADPDNASLAFPDKKVFQYFINTVLPVGLKGLVIAAIASAAMDSNLNCMATLFLKDVYQRFIDPNCSERRSMLMLHLSTLVFGAMSTAFAVFSLRLPTVLDTWFTWGGIASGGILGLFLLGVLCRRTNSVHAAVSVVIGVIMTLWMTMTLPDVWKDISWIFGLAPDPTAIPVPRSPFDKLIIPFAGTVVIFVVGAVLGLLFGKAADYAAHEGESSHS
ncbi:MAG: sodium:solute symporter family transporter [Planctomyces sp.]|jgi:SSS family solute:Na+ symporter